MLAVSYICLISAIYLSSEAGMVKANRDARVEESEGGVTDDTVKCKWTSDRYRLLIPHKTCDFCD